MLTTFQCTMKVCSITTVSSPLQYSFSDYISHTIAGPTVEANMKLSLLTPRDTETNIMFTLSFTVSFGPPSEIACSLNGNLFFSRAASVNVFAVVSREVIRSHYINSSYPDMTRVILTQKTSRESSTYTCTVYVTTRTGVGTSSFSYVQKGSGTSTASITGECCTLLTTSPPPPLPLSCKPSHCCYGQQDWFQQCSGLLVCPLISTSWL